MNENQNSQTTRLAHATPYTGNRSGLIPATTPDKARVKLFTDVLVSEGRGGVGKDEKSKEKITEGTNGLPDVASKA